MQVWVVQNVNFSCRWKINHGAAVSVYASISIHEWIITEAVLFFFAWTGTRLCPFHWYKNKLQRVQPGTSNKKITASQLAPVVIQVLASALIFSINMIADVSCRLKTLAFRSYIILFWHNKHYTIVDSVIYNYCILYVIVLVYPYVPHIYMCVACANADILFMEVSSLYFSRCLLDFLPS